MKPIKIIPIVLFIYLTTHVLLAADPIAIVIKVRGKATIESSDQKETKRLKRGFRIYDGNKIVTGKNSFVAIRFSDDASLLRIRPNSTCTINGKKEKVSIAKNIFLEVGSIFSRVFKPGAKYQVSTPTSVASVKGTIFWTKQIFRGATFYFGEEGVVEISNDSGFALLKAGETGIVENKYSKPRVRKTRKGEKPDSEAEEDGTDTYQFNFEDEQGQTMELKFKVKKKE